MENKEKVFALLIDTDNVSPKYYKIIIEELEEAGVVKIKRAYGDFACNKGWNNTIVNEGLIPVQVFRHVKNKNTTDIAMAIDAMDILHNEHVDSFCLVTSDSDFARLAQRLKEAGKYVVIAGEDKSTESLANSSNQFITLDVIYNNSIKELQTEEDNSDSNEPDRTTKKISNPRLKTLKNVVEELIEQNMEPEKGALYAIIVQQLKKRFPQFNYKVYQAKSQRDFFVDKLGCNINKEGTIDYISIN